MTDRPATRAWAAVRPDGSVVVGTIRVGPDDLRRSQLASAPPDGLGYRILPVLITIDQEPE